MAAKFLGQHLLERGLITPEHLLSALDAQRAANPTLGALALARGWLDAAQTERINARQKSRDARFGDLAVDMGLLTGAQVEALVAEQASRRKFFGEILVEQGVIDANVLLAELEAQRREREDATRSMELGVSGHPAERGLRAAVGSCVKLFPRVLHTQCQPGALVTSAADAVPCTHSASVRVAADDAAVSIALACDTATLHALAAGFVQLPAERIDDALALDALGEMVNVLMGYVAREALTPGTPYRAAPPVFGAPCARWFEPGSQALVVSLATQHGVVLLAVEA